MRSIDFKISSNKILSKGAPKQAENPILGIFCFAMLTSAAKSGLMEKYLFYISARK
jgi:hypothetical protein